MTTRLPTLSISQQLEQARIVVAAQDACREHGVAAVSLAQVAFTLRLPLATVAHYFPAGKPALLRAALTHHITFIHQQLQEQQAASNNAVEEILVMRRFLQQQMSDARSLFFQELAVDYPLLWRYSQHLRLTFMRCYLRANMQRGIREGLYYPTPRVEAQIQQWLQQLDGRLQAVLTVEEGVEAHYQQVSTFLAAITTPLGAYVVRRLQEAPPYY